MSLLAVSGDVGGARAIIPVLDYLYSNNESFTIVNHSFLADEAPKSWRRIPAVLKGDNSIESLLARGCFKGLIFGTSVKDTLPLKIARLAKQFGLYTICLLDNWMNYRYRLEIDGEETFLPDIYIVMDEVAFREACEAGIPVSVLKVMGQPALVSLGEEYHQWNIEDRCRNFETFGLNEEKKLIVFISEPAEADQGSGPECPQYRGYTEKTVLKELCDRLQPFSAKYQLGIIRHPREDTDELDKVWQQFRGTIEGKLLEIDSGRQAVFLADAVAGMASILLYEAWLINKPVISLQPGLCRPQLNFMRKREGVFCVTRDSDWDYAINAWLKEVDKENKNKAVKSDVELHTQAPVKIAKLVRDCLKNNIEADK